MKKSNKKINELNELAKRIVEMYYTDEQGSGAFKNTRWRMTGSACGVDSAGALQIGEGKAFDRWSNSVSIVVNVGNIIFDENNPVTIVEKALMIYADE